MGQREHIVRHVKSKPPKLPVYTPALDPWDWLQAVKRTLSIERCSNEDKLYSLKKAMCYEFLEYATYLDTEPHTHETYLAALERCVRNPTTLAVARAELQSMKYTLDLPPQEWLKNI